MGIFEPTSAITTSLDSGLTKVSVEEQDTAISSYTPNFSKWHGYYRTTPELGAVIDKVIIWAFGGGVKAKEKNKQAFLDKIRGFGKDTIREICMNQGRTSTICGTSAAEIKKNARGELTNLIPLNPGNIKVLRDNKGMIVRFEQWLQGKKTATWQPEEILWLPWNSIADEIGGISTIEKIESLILLRKKAQEVQGVIIERNAKPIIVIEVDADSDSALENIKTKYKNLIDKGEAMVVPRGSITFGEQVGRQYIDTIPWLVYLQKYFILAEGVPEVVLGSISPGDTEGASKILMLGYEMVVKNKQKWFEDQWKAQIGFEIEFEEPPSINPQVIDDNKKSGALDARRGNNSMDGKDSVNPTGANK